MARGLLFSVTKKDLRIEFFSGTGAGGQHRNKHQNCVRIHHPDSGAMATGQSNRNRQSNISEALHGLVKHPKFRLWHSGQIVEAMGGNSLDEIVDEAMATQHLRIENKDENGKWKRIDDAI